MKKIIFLLILILSTSCTDVNQLVEEIAKDNTLEAEHIGLTGARSEQYQNFKKLRSKASNEEIENLISHENPIIRNYAYLILIERELIKPSEAFEEAMQNNEGFSKMSGCQILGSNICTEIYFDLLNNTSKENSEFEIIDSLIIFGMDSTQFLHYMAFHDKKHKSIYNDRIRELAAEYQNESAIFYLDKHGILTNSIEMSESIDHIIEHKFVGSEPKEELIKIRNTLKDNADGEKR